MMPPIRQHEIEIAGYVIGLKERNLVIMMLNEITKMRKSDNARIIVIGAGGDPQRGERAADSSYG